MRRARPCLVAVRVSKIPPPPLKKKEKSKKNTEHVGQENRRRFKRAQKRKEQICATDYRLKGEGDRGREGEGGRTARLDRRHFGVVFRAVLKIEKEVRRGGTTQIRRKKKNITILIHCAPNLIHKKIPIQLSSPNSNVDTSTVSTGTSTVSTLLLSRIDLSSCCNTLRASFIFRLQLQF